MNDTINNDLMRLLHLFKKNYFLSASDLAASLNMSDKKIRNIIKSSADLLYKNGAEIISKSGFGYNLNVTDKDKWLDFKQNSKDIINKLPQNNSERINYIMIKLLQSNEYIKEEEFAQALYVTIPIISKNVKESELLFDKFNIKLKRTPYKGIQIIASEFNRRNCLINCFSFDKDYLTGFYPENELTIKKVSDKVINVLLTSKIYVTEMSIQALITYVYLLINRVKKGYTVDTNTEKNHLQVDQNEYFAAKDILSSFGFFSIEEIKCLAIYIASTRKNAIITHNNTIITIKINQIINDIFEIIDNNYKIDFRNNLRLRMMLGQHLLSLDIRATYRIPISNNILFDIKTDYSFSYAIAGDIIAYLSSKYGYAMSEEERGWIALIIETGLKEVTSSAKLNILVMFSGGVATLALYTANLKKHFGEYIDCVDECMEYELPYVNLNKYDLIISNVNITLPTNIPILVIEDIKDIAKTKSLKAKYSEKNQNEILRYYSEDYFYTNIKANTKEEALKIICNKIENQYGKNIGLYDAVIRREALCSTDYGNNVAIPHPDILLTNKTIVSVTILDKKIKWENNFVQVIVLVSLCNDEDDRIKNFYDSTIKFISNQKYIADLIKEPTFSNLLKIMKKIK